MPTRYLVLLLPAFAAAPVIASLQQLGAELVAMESRTATLTVDAKHSQLPYLMAAPGVQSVLRADLFRARA